MGRTPRHRSPGKKPSLAAITFLPLIGRMGVWQDNCRHLKKLLSRPAERPGPEATGWKLIHNGRGARPHPPWPPLSKGGKERHSPHPDRT